MKNILPILIAFGPACALGAASTSTFPEGLDLSTVRSVVVQHDGRWMPLDTLARDLVEETSGSGQFRGQDPVLVLLAWTFNPDYWLNEPIISIGNAELRSTLQLPADREVFSYTELSRHRPLLDQWDKLHRREQGKKLDPLESKSRNIENKLIWLGEAFNGRVISAIPAVESVGAAWETLPAGDTPKAALPAPVSQAWSAMREAFLAGNGPAFTAASTALASALNELPAAHRPVPQRIKTELTYNDLNPFRLSWMAMAVGVVFAILTMFARRRWFDVLAVVPLLAGFAMVNYGLYLRWQIAGRIPASNMYESLLFIGWGMGVFAIIAVFVLPHRLVPLSASLMGALALFLADALPMDHFVRPIAPVLLDTYWMTIHVPVIMVSYSVLAMAVILAHVQLISMAVVPENRSLQRSLDGLHYWYVMVGSILLFAGIVTGSMWAASSWGRYWGWDPKEVWSLVACLGYLAILHVRIDKTIIPAWAYVVAALLAAAVFAIVIPKLGTMSGSIGIYKIAGLLATAVAMVIFVVGRGPLAAALKSVTAFWLIIMTYVGVNYVLGTGLHSYGFGTGAVVRYMFTLGLADLALVLICCAIYLLRRPAGPMPPMAPLAMPG